MIPHEIKDICRNNLAEYLIKALSMISYIEKPLVLDIGCGTGVPTLILASHSNGTIYAVDSNDLSLSILRDKIIKLNLSERIITFHKSVLEIDFPDLKFDIIVAEGLLNIIGFESGLLLVNKIIKNGGFFIIHDEYSNKNKKLKIINRYNYKLTGSFELDENVWWDDYYQCLEKQILACQDCNTCKLFKNELEEIELFKKQPKLFRSRYFVLEKK
jgi:ubiquinone/menaquinone biosynthesis C-methylase UbiE